MVTNELQTADLDGHQPAFGHEALKRGGAASPVRYSGGGIRAQHGPVETKWRERGPPYGPRQASAGPPKS